MPPKYNEFGLTYAEYGKACDVYDEPGIECSLPNTCRFCSLIKLGEPKADFIHEDEHIIIIPDIYPEAEAHY